MEIISRNVDELAGPDKAGLEHIIGRPLQSGQQVVIAIVATGDVAALTKSGARTRIIATLQRAANQATTAGITPAMADQMLAEAMAVVRTRADSHLP
jgi:hypothetical protein